MITLTTIFVIYFLYSLYSINKKSIKDETKFDLSNGNAFELMGISIGIIIMIFLIPFLTICFLP